MVLPFAVPVSVGRMVGRPYLGRGPRGSAVDEGQCDRTLGVAGPLVAGNWPGPQGWDLHDSRIRIQSSELRIVRPLKRQRRHP